MSNILEKIVSYKVNEISYQMAQVPREQLVGEISMLPPARSFKNALRGQGGIKLIAEVKKASPSKGLIRPDFDHIAIAQAYERGGATALSVLTDKEFFQGSPQFLQEIRKISQLPLLRKDFMINPYQLYQARAWGADAVLLITGILSDEKLVEFQEVAAMLGMDCLVEVHNEEELFRALSAKAELIGINNRDLRTFSTDINNTFRLQKSISNPEVLLVSESGINTREDVLRLEEQGVNGMLVGEALMRVPDLEGQIAYLLGGVTP